MRQRDGREVKERFPAKGGGRKGKKGSDKGKKGRKGRRGSGQGDGDDDDDYKGAPFDTSKIACRFHMRGMCARGEKCVYYLGDTPRGESEARGEPEAKRPRLGSDSPSVASSSNMSALDKTCALVDRFANLLSAAQNADK